MATQLANPLSTCLGQLRDLVSLLEAVPQLDTSTMSGGDAARLARRFAAAEHACAAGRAVCGRRVAQTRHFEREGFKDAASWLGTTSGESQAASKRVLDTAEALDSAGPAQSAFMTGEISPTQAAEIAAGVKADPSTEQQLLEIAREASLHELREAVEAVRAGARSAEEDNARHERIYRARHLRTWADRDGSFAGRFALTPEDGAIVIGRLSSIADDLFDAARRAGSRDGRPVYLADALVILAGGRDGDQGRASSQGRVENEDRDGVQANLPTTQVDAQVDALDKPPRDASPDPRPTPRADCTVIAHVDLEALLRGYLLPGEESLIAGTGHVPVSVIQRMLNEAKFRLVVTKATEIASVYSFSRVIPAALRTALEHRDRCCVVPGCSSTFHLEIDHIRPVYEGGPTTLSNLCRLCRFHHSLKTRSGYRIERVGDQWRWTGANRGDP